MEMRGYFAKLGLQRIDSMQILDKSKLQTSEWQLLFGGMTRKLDFCQLFINLTLHSIIIQFSISHFKSHQEPKANNTRITLSGVLKYASAPAHHMPSRVLSHSALRTSISNTKIEFGWIPQVGKPLGP